MLNLAVLLEEGARRYSNRDAFVFNDQHLSFDQVNCLACQVANALVELGVQAGDKIALCCPNLPFFPIVYFGILKTGAVVVPLNILLKRREVVYHLRDCEARLYLCMQDLPGLPIASEGFAAFQDVDGCEHFIVITSDPAAPSPFESVKTLGSLMDGKMPIFDTIQTRGDDTAVILYTSGTTGQPKGAELTHFNMFYNAVISQDLLGSVASDIQLIVLPLFHSMAQTVMMNSGLYAGATSILVPRFEPLLVLKLMEKEKVTIFGGVPTMYWAILNTIDQTGFDVSGIRKTLRICGGGGASMAEELKLRFERIFLTQVLEGYGLSETSPAVCFTHRKEKWKPNSIGTPVWGVEVKIVDPQDVEVHLDQPGELVVRGHNVMKGYYNRPAETAQAMRSGWFHTGDVARMDDEGYFFIIDRLKDMVNRGGFNVYPREVEDVLMTHPAVFQAAVIGVQDAQYGEEVKAFIMLKPGFTIASDEIIEWCKERLASYKYPRRVEIRSSLPMTATGKILKQELKGLNN